MAEPEDPRFVLDFFPYGDLLGLQVLETNLVCISQIHR